mmetsp:Transcript_97036/g.230917  ORF Transcript_97036/g.230917 Transcript_97036/m.230917 type:complete len:265 (+) Transcript_97036:35-829(+)
MARSSRWPWLALAALGLAVAFVNSPRSERRPRVERGALKFTYFPLWAKGPAAALALQHSGLDWEGAFPEDWKTLKGTTPFLELPVLETEDAGTIGHELAILQYIATKSQKMGGAGVREMAISSQLMCEAEDIYQKLAKIKQGLITGEEAAGFWTDENDQIHNRNFGLKVYLRLLEAFYSKCAKESGDGVKLDALGGRFTSSGVSVGECKLFSTLHALKLMKEDVLSGYPNLSNFYERFAKEEATQSVLKDGGQMPGAFGQYFQL